MTELETKSLVKRNSSEGPAIWIGGSVRDFFLGLRLLRKNWAFTLSAALTLALGIGANSAVFSAVNAILLHALPYVDPEQLVNVAGFKQFATPGVVGFVQLAPRDWNEVQAGSGVIHQLGTYDVTDFTLSGQAQPLKLSGAKVSGHFFALFGIAPTLGRSVLPSDSEAGAADVVILSHRVWCEAFGCDPAVLGRRILLNQKPYAVVGVMPSTFDFGAGERGVWVPQTDQSSTSAVARLKHGVTVNEANAQLKVMAGRLAFKDPKLFGGVELVAERLGTDSGDLRTGLLILLGAVGFVLLIACVNISGLLLARGHGRLKEVAIRRALGASRATIFRQFLLEGLLLSICGGALASLFAMWGIGTLRILAPPNTPHAADMRLDPTVLLFTAVVTLFTGLLLAIGPALQMSDERHGTSLNERVAASSFGLSLRSPHHLRNAFVVLEVAMAMVLVMGATLVSRSLGNVMKLDLGFRTDRILTMSADFSPAVCNTQDKKQVTKCQLAVNNVLDQIESVPGVQAAAVTSYLPLESADGVLSMRIEGQNAKIGMEHGTEIFVRAVSADYFKAMGIPLLAGKSFEPSDSKNSAPVAVVNETFAKTYLSTNVLGCHFSVSDQNGHPQWVEIIGEVANSHDLSLLQKPSAEYYIPSAQSEFFSGANFVVRTGNDPLAIIPAIRQQIWDVDRDAPITNVRTIDQIVAEQVAQPKFRTLLLDAFGVLGLIMAIVGIYGVISHAVTQRTHEIGVRVALGAQPRQVLNMVIAEGMLLAITGVMTGTGGAFALSHFLQSLLFGIKSTDPVSFVFVAVLLMLAAFVACWIPARRATRVNPVDALRCE